MPPLFIIPGAGVPDVAPVVTTEAQFLELIDRLYPEWYLEPLKSPGPGWELYQAYAAMFARVSLAIGRFGKSSLIIYSHGGTKATCTVEFYRDSATAGAFTIEPGTVVRCSKSFREFVVLEQTAFGALAVDGVTCVVEAVNYGFEYNVTGPVTTIDGEALPGEIDELVLPFLTPVFAEPTLHVRQVNTATGGQAAVLDQLGADRGLPRQPSEVDDVYKGRARMLADTVSPDAIRRQLDAIFLPLGQSYDLIETWENRYLACWDAPDSTIPNVIFGTHDPQWFVFDDPRVDTFHGRWMGEEDHRGAFVVVVPDLQPFEQRGMAYDDPTLTAAGHSYTLGRRAHSAYNLPDLDTDFLLVGFYDGSDRERDAFYSNLYTILNNVKGGGVQISVELEGE